MSAPSRHSAEGVSGVTEECPWPPPTLSLTPLLMEGRFKDHVSSSGSSKQIPLGPALSVKASQVRVLTTGMLGISKEFSTQTLSLESQRFRKVVGGASPVVPVLCSCEWGC